MAGTPTAKCGYVILGKTGQGKSTTGNKLLGFKDREYSEQKYLYEIALPNGSIVKDSQPQPLIESTPDSLHSTTKNCIVVTNETLGISVLDMQGFADSDDTRTMGVYQGNLKIIRNMIHAQATHQFGFNRVVYFLPNRRIPEKADGNLQEELKVMHYYFGDELFNRMVIVLTNSHLEAEELKITERKTQHTEKVFLKALNSATESSLSKCPPIVYISIHDDGKKVREKLNNAKVLTNSALRLKILENTCINCAAKLHKIQIANEKLFRENSTVTDPTTNTKVDYQHSKCHPLFIPKHSTIKKFFGGISIILSLGVTALTLKMPFFFNSEEVCVNCNGPPGKPGCMKVESTFKNDDILEIKVDHKCTDETRIIEFNVEV